MRFAPQACFGAVFHERRVPAQNRFAYPVAFLRLPLSQWDSLAVPLLGVDRPQVFSVRSADHGPRTGAPLLPWLRGLLQEQGLATLADGEVVLQTMPRMFGFVFNPVSFWFCHDRAGALRLVLAEVNNTFGEQHNYLIHHADLRPIRLGDELRARKVFHVSPFFPVAGEYRFRFHAEGAVPTVAIDYWDDGECRLRTAIGGRARPLDGRAMLHWLAQYPLMSLGVVARIHWQALRLWRMRVRFFHKPPAPLEETTR